MIRVRKEYHKAIRGESFMFWYCIAGIHAYFHSDDKIESYGQTKVK